MAGQAVLSGVDNGAVVPLTRPFAKLCDPADWREGDLVGAIAAVLPERDPLAHVERKAWELGMLVLFLEQVGRLDGAAEVLAVGAGDERVVFWLTERVGRVVATDVYGRGGFAGREASAAMLEDPASRNPYPSFRDDRLEVRWMDARELDFPDGSFDVVFSLSSFEHFGSPGDIVRAAAELGRVLRPGGHGFLVTECLVRLALRDRAGTDFLLRLASLGRARTLATPWRRSRVRDAFTPRELHRRLVAPSGLELMQPLDLGLSAAAWENLTVSTPAGELIPRSGEFYPHILVKVSGSVYTSVALPLFKPGG